MKLVEKIMTKNPCYTAGRKITVKGLMLHSVGCSQPSAMVFINNWNSASYDRACVHGFIDANDGTVYQTLPWNHRGWHGGGDCNNTHIGVEMCEPACIKYTGGATFTCSDLATAKACAKRTYDAAVELFAMLCKQFNLNPLADGVIISHKEGHARGIASNHGDPEHLWNQLSMGYTMNTFRQAVKAAMNTTQNQGDTTKDDATTIAQPDKIWNTLKTWIGNDYGVAGLMGNLYAESGLIPNNLQNTHEKSLGLSDAQYTSQVDNGKYTNFVKDGAGYGLAQWTFWSRKQALKQFADGKQASIGNLNMQLDFLKKEISENYASLLNTLKNAKSVSEASNAVLTTYERPADQGDSVKQKRTSYGQKFFDQYHQKTQTSGVMYYVQVGAYSVKANADNQLAKVKAAGFDAFIKKIDNLYKVQVGAYSVKANADAMVEKVKKAGFDVFITTNGSGEAVASTTTTVPKKSIDELAKEVIQGKWGNGDARKQALTKAGYDYSAVQKRVNQMLS